MSRMYPSYNTQGLSSGVRVMRDTANNYGTQPISSGQTSPYRRTIGGYQNYRNRNNINSIPGQYTNPRNTMGGT